MNKKRLLQAGTLLVCLAVIAAGAVFGPSLWNSLHSSPVTNLTTANYQKVLKDSNTPVYIEFCGKNYSGCTQQEKTDDSLSGSYRGKVLFARVDVDTQPALVQDLLGVNESAISKLPIVVVADNKSAGLLAIADGVQTSAQVKDLLQGSLDQLAADNQHLIHVISASDLAAVLQNGASQPTLIEICSAQDGSCIAEAGAVAHNALAYKGKLTVDVFVVESAQTAQEQQLVQSIAMTLGLQSVPDFLFAYDKYGNLAGALDSAQLNSFIAQGIASGGK